MNTVKSISLSNRWVHNIDTCPTSLTNIQSCLCDTKNHKLIYGILIGLYENKTTGSKDSSGSSHIHRTHCSLEAPKTPKYCRCDDCDLSVVTKMAFAVAPEQAVTDAAVAQ